jgi:hypothetical protein
VEPVYPVIAETGTQSDRLGGLDANLSVGNLGYIAGIGIAFLSAPASLALSGLVAVYYIFEQTPARAQPLPDNSDPTTTAAASDPTRTGQ